VTVIRRLRGKVFVSLFEIIRFFENHHAVFVETWAEIRISFQNRHLNVIAVRKQNVGTRGGGGGEKKKKG